MADLSDTDLALIRDEVGTDEPTNDELYSLWDDLGSWRKIAVRVLKRRRAANVAASAGTVSSISVPGAVAVGFSRGDLASLDRQILRLQGEIARDEETPLDPLEGVGFTGRLRRRDRIR